MTDAKPQLDGATIAEEDDGIRLDRWFKRHREGTPHALLARWARSGQLTLDGKKADVSDRIATGQKLVMPTPPVEAAARGPVGAVKRRNLGEKERQVGGKAGHVRSGQFRRGDDREELPRGP